MAARGSPRRLHAAVTSDDALNLQRTSENEYTQFIRGVANKPRIVPYFLFQFGEIAIFNVVIWKPKENQHV
jgi:hypothetical protein